MKMRSNPYYNHIREVVASRQESVGYLFIQVPVPSKDTTRKIMVDFVLVWWGLKREYIAQPIKLNGDEFYYIESMDISDTSARYLKWYLQKNFGVRHVRIRTPISNTSRINSLLQVQTLQSQSRSYDEIAKGIQKIAP
jgi:hypothetical protein